MSENNSFAYRKFKELCSKNAMTAYQVAKATDGRVSATTLSCWKSGQYEPKFDKLQAIATVFDVPVTEFIE